LASLFSLFLLSTAIFSVNAQADATDDAIPSDDDIIVDDIQ